MSDAQQPAKLPAHMLAALGIVYGDLGTSPLYTMQTILSSSGGDISAASVTGVLSLIIWALLLIVSLKYGLFVMKADNHGEGGILALTSLVTSREPSGSGTPPGGGRGERGGLRTGVLISIGLAGAALIYGDGILTPSISVLSAVEGVKVAAPSLGHLVLPVALAILVALFALQTFGTARIGKLFGPVMLLWFATIGVFGAITLARHPEVLAAINPLLGLRYLAHHGTASLIVLGGVFLSLTGAEALYADMGHVGRRPIRLAWYGLVLPALLLCYAGQSASLIGLSKLPDNPFYGILPDAIRGWAIWPLLVLATCATIIASQAIITGSFSMTRQAIQLGWFPGLNIRQTSDTEYGQIYVAAVNWLLMIFTVAITLAFGSSERLAGAYGMAVSTTMLLTTALLFSYLRGRAGWSLPASLAVTGFFLVIDLAFFSANLLKFFEGGFVPLLAGLLVFLLMDSWRRGMGALRDLAHAEVADPERFLARLREEHVPRVPGTTVFLTRLYLPIPALMVSHMEQFGVLQEHIVTLTVLFEQRPRVPVAGRVSVQPYEANLWHVTVRYGFVEIPDLSTALELAREKGCPVIPADALFIGRRDEIVRERTGRRRLLGWQRLLFGFLYRNAVHFVDRFHLPADHLVEVGRRIGL